MNDLREHDLSIECLQLINGRVHTRRKQYNARNLIIPRLKFAHHYLFWNLRH